MDYVDVVEVNICIICNSSEGVLNILKDPLEDEGVLLHEALEFITCQKVMKIEDKITKTLCLACNERLLDAYRFKNQALESYKSLQDISAPTEDRFVDKHNVEQQSNGLVVNKKSTDIPEIDMSTDAVTFLIELHLNNSTKNAPEPTAESSPAEKEFKELSPFMKLKHECTICGKLFRKTSNLIDHLRLHANEKKFACSYCDKRFVQVANFRMHERIHTKERPFKCSLCFKAYNQSSSLKIHMRSHTQERNYICSICFKAFTNSSDLNKHNRVHDPSKHFKCEFCERNFAQKANMKAHQRKIHAKELNS